MGGVLNVVQLIAVGITFFVLDRFGRRFWLLQGSVGMSLSHIIIAVLVAKFSYNWAENVAQAWVCVAFMFVFMLSYGISWSPIAWSLPSEVHTSSYRGKGVALATAVVWISNFVIVSQASHRLEHVTVVLTLETLCRTGSGHSSSHQPDRIRYLCLLRRFLGPFRCLDLFLRARNQVSGGTRRPTRSSF